MNYYVSRMGANRIDDGQGINEHFFTFGSNHAADDQRLVSCLRIMPSSSALITCFSSGANLENSFTLEAKIAIRAALIGDVYRFVMKADGVDFLEAHRRLGGHEAGAKLVGVAEQQWLERAVDHHHAR